MPPKRPGPKSKTVPNPADDQDSSSSDSSGFLPTPSPISSRPQQGNQPPQDPVAGPSNSISRPRQGILKNSNLSHRSEPDSGFVNRDDVTDSIRSPLVNEGARGNKTGSGGGDGGSSSSSHSHFLDDNRNDHSGTRHSIVIILLELLLSQWIQTTTATTGGGKLTTRMTKVKMMMTTETIWRIMSSPQQVMLPELDKQLRRAQQQQSQGG